MSDICHFPRACAGISSASKNDGQIADDPLSVYDNKLMSEGVGLNMFNKTLYIVSLIKSIHCANVDHNFVVRFNLPNA